MKKKSLEDSLRGHSSGIIESEGVVKTVGKKKFGELLDKCERKIDFDLHDDKITEVLTPEDLDLFLQCTVLFGDRGGGWYLGINAFLDKLTKNSYNAGNHNFVFHTDRLPPMRMGYGFMHDDGRPFVITINGHSDGAGQWASGVEFRLNGDVGERCGAESYECTSFLVDGNAGNLFGTLAKGSKFEITGDVGDRCGYRAKNATYILNGDIGVHCGQSAVGCSFKTTNRKTLGKLVGMVPSIDDKDYQWIKDVLGTPTKNKIMFINKDGSEELVRDYS